MSDTEKLQSKNLIPEIRAVNNSLKKKTIAAAEVSIPTAKYRKARNLTKSTPTVKSQTTETLLKMSCGKVFGS